MIQARIGRLALRAYPREACTACGEEMLGTLLDAADDSLWAFVIGCISLLVGGLRERARMSTAAGPVRLIADGFCQAAVLWSVWRLARWRLPPHGYSTTWPLLSLILLIAVVVCSMLGRDRIAGICGLAVIGHQIFQARSFGGSVGTAGVPHYVFVIQWAVFVACFAALVLKPRRHTCSRSRLIWLVAAIAVWFVSLPVGQAALLIGVPLVAIIRLPVNPRLAIASAALWTVLAVTDRVAQTNLGLITVPILLLAILLAAAQRELVIRTARR